MSSTRFRTGGPVPRVAALTDLRVGYSAWCRKVAAVIPVSREVLADLAATWQERAVILGAADPNPFPRIRLWRTKETR